MARIKKRGTSGNAKNFITRTQAVRKLQISLPDFRRLCIFKGIYPREPRNKKKASKSSTQLTTFYYTKDIQYLLHEPLLAKFREHKALAKKIGRALGKGQVSDAARLERTHTPRITLDHIIKERYPTFNDALRDLDDALSMLFLFANLPSTATVPPKKITLCQRLCLEFEHYLIITHSLRKSFLSIKGIYYQATIQGQDVMWIVPYKFVQRVTGDVDFRIMGTFVEFYTTLLGFVNYRLYSSIGLVYPPKFDPLNDEGGGELSAYTLQGREGADSQMQIEAAGTEDVHENTMTEATARAQAAADALQSLGGAEDEQENVVLAEDEEEGGDSAALDAFTPAATDTDILPQPQISSNDAATLFSSMTFFISRETPRAPLEFILRAFGSKRVGWDILLGPGSATSSESDPSITHQIVDRPVQPINSAIDQDDDETPPPTTSIAPGTRFPGRIYVQPQWVWDCINAGELLPVDLYVPGATLPPHLSPWVKPDARRGEYDPTAPLAEQEREGEAEAAEAEFEAEDAAALGEDALNGDGGAWSGLSDNEAEQANADDDDDDEVDEDDVEEDEDGAAARAYQRELEAEATGRAVASVPPSAATAKAKARAKVKAKADAAAAEADEELERRKMMLSRRKRKLLEMMLHGNSKRDNEAEKLRAKRRRAEREREKQRGV